MTPSSRVVVALRKTLESLERESVSRPDDPAIAEVRRQIQRSIAGMEVLELRRLDRLKAGRTATSDSERIKRI